MVDQAPKEYIFNIMNNKYPGLVSSIEDMNSTTVINEIFSNYEHEIGRNSKRWWDEVELVGKIGEKYFKWTWASANRDESIFDLGWEFEWNSVVEVKPVEKVIKVVEWIVV